MHLEAAVLQLFEFQVLGVALQAEATGASAVRISDRNQIMGGVEADDGVCVLVYYQGRVFIEHGSRISTTNYRVLGSHRSTYEGSQFAR